MKEIKLEPCPLCGGKMTIRCTCEQCGLTVEIPSASPPSVTLPNTRADDHWISVKDALPKTRHKKTIDDYVYWDSDPVAVVTVDDIGDSSIGVGIYYVGREDGKLVSAWDGFTVEDVGLYNCTVTHWRPLPKLPEVEK